ncbi:MAG: hypothetical protein OXC99_07755 [Chloroflexi bacterium]|nr:hypothetical protein [Chloroflexota bacterium]
MIKPEFLGQLSTKAIWWCGVLIFVQWLHSVAYTNLEGVHLAINSFGHKLALAGYAVATVWLFNLRWVEAKSRPPRSPTDD